MATFGTPRTPITTRARAIEQREWENIVHERVATLNVDVSPRLESLYESHLHHCEACMTKLRYSPELIENRLELLQHQISHDQRYPDCIVDEQCRHISQGRHINHPDCFWSACPMDPRNMTCHSMPVRYFGPHTEHGRPEEPRDHRFGQTLFARLYKMDPDQTLQAYLKRQAASEESDEQTLHSKGDSNIPAAETTGTLPSAAQATIMQSIEAPSNASPAAGPVQGVVFAGVQWGAPRADDDVFGDQYRPRRHRGHLAGHSTDEARQAYSSTSEIHRRSQSPRREISVPRSPRSHPAGYTPVYTSSPQRPPTSHSVGYSPSPRYSPSTRYSPGARYSPYPDRPASANQPERLREWFSDEFGDYYYIRRSPPRASDRGTTPEDAILADERRLAAMPISRYSRVYTEPIPGSNGFYESRAPLEPSPGRKRRREVEVDIAQDTDVSRRAHPRQPSSVDYRRVRFALPTEHRSSPHRRLASPNPFTLYGIEEVEEFATGDEQ